MGGRIVEFFGVGVEMEEGEGRGEGGSRGPGILLRRSCGFFAGYADFQFVGEGLGW